MAQKLPVHRLVRERSRTNHLRQLLETACWTLRLGPATPVAHRPDATTLELGDARVRLEGVSVGQEHTALPLDAGAVAVVLDRPAAAGALVVRACLVRRLVARASRSVGVAGGWDDCAALDGGTSVDRGRSDYRGQMRRAWASPCLGWACRSEECRSVVLVHQASDDRGHRRAGHASEREPAACAAGTCCGGSGGVGTGRCAILRAPSSRVSVPSC
jgi:hypothetical protein